MTVSGQRKFDIKATPAEVMDAVAAVELMPEWSPTHTAVTVETRYPDGRPHRVHASISVVALHDEQIIDYVWNGVESVTWTLVEAKLQATQIGTYTLTPSANGTDIVFDLEFGTTVPLPGFVQRRVLGVALDAATKKFKKYAESR